MNLGLTKGHENPHPHPFDFSQGRLNPLPEGEENALPFKGRERVGMGISDEKLRRRLADSIEIALRISDGIVVINQIGGEEILFSERLACIDCGISYPEVTPRVFSFNSPHGACPDCDGLGIKIMHEDEEGEVCPSCR